MGILSHKAPPPTALGLDDAGQPPRQPSGDPEKANTDVQHEDGVVVEHTHDVDPELERRVVRKLDWHLPPLVGFLCEPGLQTIVDAVDSDDVVCPLC